MDILASILAYLVSLAGIVGTLAISLFVFFSPPGAQPPASAQADATALLVSPSMSGTPAATPGKPRPSPVTTIAVDTRQKHPASHVQSRLLSERERARHLAYREGADFETRFLHKDD